MRDVKDFLNIARESGKCRQVDERVKDYKPVAVLRPQDLTQEQARRCMECGTPFCHWGCPLGNLIPEWNDLVCNGQWEKAYKLLSAANNFPEFTGRVCPAYCEAACVLGINDQPVTCRENELGIIEYAFSRGLVKSKQPKRRTGKKIAVIGSGPAGLACADQLNSAGHSLTVFERDDRLGGWLRYGIPDFKLEKSVIDRRLALMREAGVIFKTGVEAGKDISAQQLLADFDAVCLAGGARVPRDLSVEGRDLAGIYFAGDYLRQSNKRVAGDAIPQNELIDAKGKNVVVIGGGDTGSDCIGTAHRQGAASVAQIEVLPQPPYERNEKFPWPKYPMLMKTTTSHEEGGVRQWCVLTKKFIGENNRVKSLSCVRVDFAGNKMQEIPNSSFALKADLVLLAVGFVAPVHQGLLDSLGAAYDKPGNVQTGDELMTSIPKVFACGDMHTGQSLVMKAISQGRQAAHHIDKYLMGTISLPLI